MEAPTLGSKINSLGGATWGDPLINLSKFE
jgi:hypothetical protein